jgi:hypothetical protein
MKTPADEAKSLAKYFDWDDNSEQVREVTSALEARDKKIEGLKKALESCRVAMIYAYEDHADHYYMNVLTDIKAALREVGE